MTTSGTLALFCLKYPQNAQLKISHLRKNTTTATKLQKKKKKSIDQIPLICPNETSHSRRGLKQIRFVFQHVFESYFLSLSEEVARFSTVVIGPNLARRVK